jgi:phosphatidylserine/phosphatidylglycerophosphate/cardiolipin synthase-like enzyme
MKKSSQKFLIPVFLSLALALVFFFWPDFQMVLAPAPTATTAPPGIQLPLWLSLYFTDPTPPDNLAHGIDQFVQASIDGAIKTIDVASFDLNLPSVVNALARASQRGVSVNVVFDGTNGNLSLDNAATGNQPFDSLHTLGTAAVGLVNAGRSEGLMHDKFILVDGKTLFTGSWNLSYNDTYRNNNNLLEISAPELIANYQAKFNELYVDRRFGSRAQVMLPNPSVSIGGVQVETYMAPEDNVMARLIQLVEGAQKSVHFMAYTFTHEELANAMIARSQSKIDVQGVIEEHNASQGSLADLYCGRVAVRTDGNPYNMHHKVIIIDGETVITGSFNFTWSADTENDENVLVIHDRSVAAMYEQEYQKMYKAGKEPKGIACNP